MNIALTGDVMLGRLVDDTVIRNSGLTLLLKTDLRFVNLECIISQNSRQCHTNPKPG